MVHFIRKVVYKRMQQAAMLTCAKVVEAVRELDGLIEVSKSILAMLFCISLASNLLAQLVYKICETLRAINFRYAVAIRRPPRHGQLRHLSSFL